MIKNISTILTLYKTPLNKLHNLKQYKDFRLFLFEQEGNEFSEKKPKAIKSYIQLSKIIIIAIGSIIIISTRCGRRPV